MSHVAASLRRHGHKVTLADLRYDDDNLDDIVRTCNPGIIGLSLRNIDDHRIDDTIFFAPEVSATARRLRRVSSATIILGGSAYSLFPVELLVNSEADYGIVGEGEASMVQLTDVLSAGRIVPSSLHSIPGLVYREKNRVRQNPVVPLDAKTAILSPYRPAPLSDAYMQHSGVANLQTQRGCSFTCCYCTYPIIEGTALRTRDPRAVADEAAELEARGIRYFFIVDSVFNADTDHAAAVCEAFLQRGITAAWSCFLRPAGITAGIMELMARAGLRHIEFGTDSLSDPVLAAYGKQFTVEDIVTADHAAEACGVRHAHFLICGGPGETIATLEESFRNSLLLKKTVIFPFVGMRLYPKTALHRIAQREKAVDESMELLQPFFYLAEGLEKQSVTALLAAFHERSPRWVVKDPSPEQLRVIERLRAKRIPGPLWEFLAQ
jgi:radical SAM superfamily enzyme YgiQ (UPF0313 family)